MASDLEGRPLAEIIFSRGKILIPSLNNSYTKNSKISSEPNGKP